MFPKWFPKVVVAISGDSVIGWTSEKGYTEYKTSKEMIKKFLNNFGISYLRVSDRTWVNLSYIKLVTRKNNWINIYFYNDFTLHFDCEYLDEIEIDCAVRTFDRQCNMFIDLDASYETDGKDGWVAYVETIELEDIFGYTYVNLKICDNKPVYVNRYTLGDFLHSLKVGSIWRNDTEFLK